MIEINDVLKKYEYPGRGIVVGINNDNTEFFLAYFLTGRSFNSKNRILELDSNKNLKTKPFNKEKLETAKYRLLFLLMKRQKL